MSRMADLDALLADTFGPAVVVLTRRETVVADSRRGTLTTAPYPLGYAAIFAEVFGARLAKRLRNLHRIESRRRG